VKRIALPMRLATTCRILFSSASTTAGTGLRPRACASAGVAACWVLARPGRRRSRASWAPANAIGPVAPIGVLSAVDWWAIASRCAGGAASL